ncbi:MAG: RNA polymerase sigma factor [Armatimonadetes bacterium]|nr:RNA polymerase sigma factor [Armatimonadota bacterium]
MDDRELANALKRQEPYALELLVERYHGPLFRFIRHLTRHRETAEDLTQQTLLTAHRKIGSFRGDSTLSTWLHRIAFREYTGWRRKRRILVPLELLRGVHEPAYAQIDEAEALLQKLHTLPAPTREALLLHHVQGLSIEEIAVVTETPVGTVKSRLHHGRKRLQEPDSPSQETLRYDKQQ